MSVVCINDQSIHLPFEWELPYPSTVAWDSKGELWTPPSSDVLVMLHSLHHQLPIPQSLWQDMEETRREWAQMWFLYLSVGIQQQPELKFRQKQAIQQLQLLVLQQIWGGRQDIYLQSPTQAARVVVDEKQRCHTKLVTFPTLAQRVLQLDAKQWSRQLLPAWDWRQELFLFKYYRPPSPWFLEQQQKLAEAGGSWACRLADFQPRQSRVTVLNAVTLFPLIMEPVQLGQRLSFLLPFVPRSGRGKLATVSLDAFAHWANQEIFQISHFFWHGPREQKGVDKHKSQRLPLHKVWVDTDQAALVPGAIIRRDEATGCYVIRLGHKTQAVHPRRLFWNKYHRIQHPIELKGWTEEDEQQFYQRCVHVLDEVEHVTHFHPRVVLLGLWVFLQDMLAETGRFWQQRAQWKFWNVTHPAILQRVQTGTCILFQLLQQRITNHL